jgi:hypothetical protein
MEGAVLGIGLIVFVGIEAGLIFRGQRGEHITPMLWGTANGLFVLGNFAGAYQDPSTRTRHIIGGLIYLAGVGVANIPVLVSEEDGKKDEYNITATLLSPALLLTGIIVGGSANNQPPVVIIVPPPIPAT